MDCHKDHPEVSILRICFYAVLLVAMAWDLGRLSLRGIRFPSASDIEDRFGCQLDSFSEPAIAAAVFKREAEHSFRAYVQARDLEAASATLLTGGSEHTRTGPGSLPNPPGRAARLAATQSLEQLGRKILETKSDIDCKLLAIYSESGSWNEFVDRYLEFLRESPENPFVAVWAPCALVRSQDCHRTGEVTEALHHAIQINLDAKTARCLARALEQWGTGEGIDLEARNP